LKRPVDVEKYVGQYHDEGYGIFNVTLDCDKQELPEDSPASPTTTHDGCRLVIISPGRPGEEASVIRLDLEHISGDYWVGWAYMPHLRKYHRPLACQRVEFRVDAAGVVASLGVDVRLEGEDIPLVWFERVAD
jgi:hypothetical protein